MFGNICLRGDSQASHSLSTSATPRHHMSSERMKVMFENFSGMLYIINIVHLNVIDRSPEFFNERDLTVASQINSSPAAPTLSSIARLTSASAKVGPIPSQQILSFNLSATSAISTKPLL